MQPLLWRCSLAVKGELGVCMTSRSQQASHSMSDISSRFSAAPLLTAPRREHRVGRHINTSAGDESRVLTLRSTGEAEAEFSFKSTLRRDLRESSSKLGCWRVIDSSSNTGRDTRGTWLPSERLCRRDGEAAVAAARLGKLVGEWRPN